MSNGASQEPPPSSAGGAVERAARILARRAVPLLLLLGVPVFLANFFAGKPGINGWDVNFYYAYTASMIDRGTLEVGPAFATLVERGADPAVFDATRTSRMGRTHNFYPIGHALLNTPAAALGALLSRALESRPGGYSITAQLLYCLSAIGLASVGIELMRRVAAEIAGELCAGAAVWLMAACSMLGYYWFVLPAHSHTSSLLLVGVMAWSLWRLMGGEASPWHALALGVAVGWNGMVRLQDVGLGALAFAGLCVIVRNPGLDAHRRVQAVALLAIGGLAGFAPQVLHWMWKDGVPWPTNYGDGTTFDWRSPHAWSVLTSPRHGLFLWHPVLLAAAVGAAWLGVVHRASRPLVLAFGAAFLGVLWVGGSFSIWWFGDSFGSRPFLSLAPIFVLGLAHLCREMAARGRRSLVAVGVLGVALGAWNAVLAIGFHLGWMSRSGPMDPAAIAERLQALF